MTFGWGLERCLGVGTGLGLHAEGRRPTTEPLLWGAGEQSS